MVMTLLRLLLKRSRSHFSEKVVEGHPLYFGGRCVECFSNTCCSHLQRQKWMFFAVTGSNGKQPKICWHSFCPPPTWPIKHRSYNNEIGLPIRFCICQKRDGQTGPGARPSRRYPSLIRTGASKAAIVTLDWGSPFEAKDRSEIAKGNPDCGRDARRWPSGSSSWSDRRCLPSWKSNSRPLWSRRGDFATELIERKDSLTFRANF